MQVVPVINLLPEFPVVVVVVQALQVQVMPELQDQLQVVEQQKLIMEAPAVMPELQQQLVVQEVLMAAAAAAAAKTKPVELVQEGM